MKKKNYFILAKITASYMIAFGLVWTFVQSTSANFGLNSIPLSEIVKSLNQPNPQSQKVGLHIIKEDLSGILMEFNLPKWELKTSDSEDGECQFIEMVGFGKNAIAGTPSLPVNGDLVGVPLETALGIQVLESEWIETPGRYYICPAATPVIVMNSEGETKITGYHVKRELAAYNKNEFFPESPIEIARYGFIRSQRLAVLKIQPFKYNPVTGQISYASYIRFRLNFSWSEKQTELLHQMGNKDEGPFENTLRNGLINYENARNWRILLSKARILQKVEVGVKPPALKLMVLSDGIYTIKYADLRTAGVPVDSLDPRTFLLKNNGQEIATFVSGGSDRFFHPDDYLLFFGQKANTKWTDLNVYWLTWNESNGLRMKELGGTPSGTFSVPTIFTNTQTIEKNIMYLSSIPSGVDNDHWYWAYLNASVKPVKQGFSFTLPYLAMEPVSATVSGLLVSYYANPQHHTRVYINKHLVDDAFWPHPGELAFKTKISQSFLISGTNVITVELPRESGVITSDVTLVNRFAIDYSRWYTATQNELLFTGQPGDWEFQIGGFTTNTVQVFDVTTPTQPVRITGVVLDGSTGNFRLRFEQSLDSEHRLPGYAAFPLA